MKSQNISEENEVCRKIVKEIEMFGISDRQRYFVIYLLAQNLENIEICRELCIALKEINPQAFISQYNEQSDNNPKILLDS